MAKQRIPSFTVDMFSHLPDQTVEILNRLVAEVNESQGSFTELTNAVIMLQNQIKNLSPTPTPTPTGEWQQILAFNWEDMGDTDGMCLQNVEMGYGFSYGSFNSAREDMDSQIANGTLHAGTPPADIAVPIYYDNTLADGHVAVWDHGRVYSDKRLYANIDAVTGGYAGWGELCGGVRVVSRIS